MKVKVKICGIKDASSLNAAIDAGADFVGFVFFEKSPRYIDPVEAGALCKEYKEVGNVSWKSVALLVNPTDDYIKKIISDFQPDIIQLYGAENKNRTVQIRTILPKNIEIMKCFGIASKKDIDDVQGSDCLDVVDYLLFDAKPPKGSLNPGGNAISFDWKMLGDIDCFKDARGRVVPWMLAGGLSADNVVMALTESGAHMVDVSSGVEASVGIKDNCKIKEFVGVVQKISL